MKEQQYFTINLRVTKEQKERMARNAAASGLSLSAFIRYLTLSGGN